MEKPYAQQIVCVNKKIDALTDSILASARRPLVIIIQGDHGYRYYDKPDRQKEFAVFHAVYFSSQDYRLYSDSVSSVNTFRLVFNTFFKKDFRLLENKK